jgi:hypothetical protein
MASSTRRVKESGTSASILVPYARACVPRMVAAARATSASGRLKERAFRLESGTVSLLPTVSANVLGSAAADFAAAGRRVAMWVPFPPVTAPA